MSYNYLKIIVRSTHDSDLQRDKISVKNIVSLFKSTISDELAALLFYYTLYLETVCIHLRK